MTIEVLFGIGIDVNTTDFLNDYLLHNCFEYQVNEEHVGLVMEALSHRKAEVTDMGPVPGSIGRTRMSLTCPSRLVL